MRGPSELNSRLDGVSLISTDVFDTLLLRRLRSERSRIVEAERLFARFLGERGFLVSVERLVDLRLRAQALAHRAVNMNGNGEVGFLDITRRQLQVLGLPEELAQDRLGIEIEVEKRSLRPNRALAAALRRSGLPVVAISDTGLPAAAIAGLIEHHHGPELISRVYSSADEAATKRQGDIFLQILAAEEVAPHRLLHVGDDAIADHEVPCALGIRTLHLPRARLRLRVSRMHGAAAEARRRLDRAWVGGRRVLPTPGDTASFAGAVLGPIVAEFCLRIWLYADQLRKDDDAILLFCARGGLGIREAFERLLDRLHLRLDTPRENLLISRLVAARAAIARRSPAAVEELSREFRDSSFADVAQALSGRNRELPASWSEPFMPDQLYDLFKTPAGQQVVDDIDAQNALFRRHLKQVSAGRGRLVLCDTGLYGSTQRLLADGFPELSIETVQLARSNYKGHSEAHFPRVVGLLVEQDVYSPFQVETTVLRYWQLVESLFEPAIPSVRHFHEDAAGDVLANSGCVRREAVDVAAGNALLRDVLAYIDQIPDGATLLDDAERAWPRLKQAITRPSTQDLHALDVGRRSVDFGRSGVVAAINGNSPGHALARLSAVRSHLWREGAIAREFPHLRPALLLAMEAGYAVRGLSAQWLR